MRHARPDYDRFQDPAGLIPEDEVILIRGQDQAAIPAMEAMPGLRSAEWSAAPGDSPR